METYHFVTNWHFNAPIDRVWDELVNVGAWPTWWASWRKAQSRSGESQPQLGSIMDHEVRGTLPYSLHFTTEVILFQPPQFLETTSSGDLVGNGKFMLEQRDDGTAVTYYWDVATSNPVFNLLGKLSFIRTMIEKNHDYVIRLSRSQTESRKIAYSGYKQNAHDDPDMPSMWRRLTL